MADVKTQTNYFWVISFWVFVVVKVAGTIFAPGSWWWVFLPFVPIIGEIVHRQGL